MDAVRVTVTDLNGVTLAFRVLAAMFFVGLGLVFQGLVVLMGYEAVALVTKAAPTISFVGSYEFLRHPVWWVTLACMVAFAFGALVTHFTHWTP